MGTLRTLLLAAAAAGFASAASAGTVYNNPININGLGDCSFNTACAAYASRGDEFVAQQFTITSSKVVIGASFSEYNFGSSPTDVNWGFLMADGAGGLPGTILSAGEDTVTASNVIGNFDGANVSQDFFGVGPQALGPGTYYFAFQAVSTDIAIYLGQGMDPTGAAESNDGGVTWAFGYENGAGGDQLGGVAVALYDAPVPEPATWAMMIMGVAGIGFAMRRQAKLRVA